LSRGTRRPGAAATGLCESRITPSAGRVANNVIVQHSAAMTAGTEACADLVVDYRAVAALRGQPIAFVDSRGPTVELSRAALFDDARAVAAGLTHHGLRVGDRVVLVATTSPDFLIVLVGCLLAGVAPCTVAMPAHPTDPESTGVRNLRTAVAAVAPAAAIAIGPGTVPLRSDRTVLTVDDLRAHGATPMARLPVPDPDRVHHIQMTSGSTASPKAVLLTHRNVAANLHGLAMSTGLQPGRDAISIWLPLHHDMGLVQVLLSLTGGIGLDLMSPLGFLRDPLSWLRHMDERSATLTGAPPFAYNTIAERQQKRPSADLDLSRIRQMYVGAEPLPMAVLRNFRDTFVECGLADDVLVPCYGMAEAVLASSFALDVRPADDLSFGRVRAVSFDRCALDDRRIAMPAIDSQPSRTMVSCGRAVPGLDIRIVGEDGSELPDGQVGSITLSGSSLMAGYQAVGGPANLPAHGMHDTGDIGVRYEGELYVVGRATEMLSLHGRRLPPYDIETVIEEHPLVGVGRAAVFGYDMTEGAAPELVVAFVETNAPEADWETLREELRARVEALSGVSLADVVVVRRGTIPRTSSGKRQRVALRQTYSGTALSAVVGR
jgi:fatty-acyl-CoA synthase